MLNFGPRPGSDKQKLRALTGAKYILRPMIKLSAMFIAAIAACALVACGSDSGSSEQQELQQLVENEDSPPVAIADQFVALSNSGQRVSCDFLARSYKQDLQRDLNVSADELCSTLYPQSGQQLKVKSVASELFDKTDQQVTTLSWVCLEESRPVSGPPGKDNKINKKSYLSGPLLTKMSYQNNRWELLSLPSFSSFSAKEKPQIKKLRAKIAQQC